MKMKIVKMALSDIHPYKNNAKKHPQKQIDQIIYSIEQYGFNDPIAIDENNMIVEGHGRYMALQQMGKKYAPCIQLTDMDEEQKKAYILAHNQLTMSTGYDLPMLKREIEKIKKSGFKVDMLGFDDVDMNMDMDIDEMFEKGDLRKVGGGERYKVVKCPHCGRKMKVRA